MKPLSSVRQELQDDGIAALSSQDNMLETSMKAIVLTKPCQAEEMALTEIPVPQARPGWVLMKV